ncbi:MAG TPA: amylo-alpha-1,6-glucosidase [Blastocatellia bacterium]|nr:amylo-alpha-1,6-glucosidase [Blastocatellia bacterium]
MADLIRRLTDLSKLETDALLSYEWLVTNGLGGYASGTVAGVATRRFHGLLIAALPAPLGRLMMFNHLAEYLILPDGSAHQISGEEQTTTDRVITSAQSLAEFRLEAGLPVWVYQVGNIQVEKRVLLPHLQNTVQISWKLLAGAESLQLRLRPGFYFRPHEGLVSTPLSEPYKLTIVGDRYEISTRDDYPPLRLLLQGDETRLTLDRGILENQFYTIEANRGYDSQGALWSPGYFGTRLTMDQTTTLLASTETWLRIQALTPAEAYEAERERRRRLLFAAPQAAHQEMGAELVLAADQFIITPAGRAEEAVRIRAAGDEVRTVIAGYHWFTDWGRDTMISLEGLTLSTGRYIEAGWILRTFAHYVRNGLIPNMFPEGEKEGLYHTADATLWFFHALERYLQYTHDGETLRMVLPVLQNIIRYHLAGTQFGIGVDAEDGLLRQGAEGYQLTWMDAKVGDWVVTPRRGKAVEINALWYNALRLMEGWLRESGNETEADRMAAQAEKTYESFNRRFWYDKGQYLYDVVDGEAGDDSAFRPNQLFAFSLSHPVLNPEHWATVLKAVHEKLYTPFGLRSLAPEHQDYKSKYYGDLRSRDAAYHQGTVWGWLIGPFVDAWLKVHPDDVEGARRFVQAFEPHLNEGCVGSISEIFDAEQPYTQRGCVAQAWSVAEALRCWVKTSAAGGQDRLPHGKQ